MHDKIIYELNKLKMRQVNNLIEYNNKKIDYIHFKYKELEIFNQMHELYYKILKQYDIMDNTYISQYSQISY